MVELLVKDELTLKVLYQTVLLLLLSSILSRPSVISSHSRPQYQFSLGRGWIEISHSPCLIAIGIISQILSSKMTLSIGSPTPTHVL